MFEAMILVAEVRWEPNVGRDLYSFQETGFLVSVQLHLTESATPLKRYNYSPVDAGKPVNLSSCRMANAIHIVYSIYWPDERSEGGLLLNFEDFLFVCLLTSTVAEPVD